MSESGAPPAADVRSPSPRSRHFTRKPAMSPEQKHRQAVITDAAWRHFLSGPAMISFLNVAHPELGGRPLDVAMNSDEGLTAVLRILSPA